MFHKKINKKVNKPNIRNLENWLFDDVSEILIMNYREITKVLKGCENISQNVPIRHQNIRERNCQ